MSNIPRELVVWSFSGKAGNAPVQSQNTYDAHTGYSLHCAMNNQYLTYGKEPLGINLVWAKFGTDKKIHFRVPDKRERPLLTGESIAFGIGGGDAFLFYKERNVGVNLDWSNKPVFEWTIHGESGVKGQPISQGSKFSLINSKVKPSPDFLIYLDRVSGQADVGWTTSPNWPGRIVSNVDKYKGLAKLLAA